MRALGYLFLFLLALYFTVLKPYLLAKRVELDIESLSLSLKEGITLKSLLLQLPAEHTTFHLSLKGVSLQPWQLQAEELSFIEVSSAPPSDKPFDYDFTALIELAGKLNLKVKELYISKNYLPQRESMALFINAVELRAGRFFSEGLTQVYWMRGRDTQRLDVFLQDARLIGGEILIDKAQLRSKQYEFELRGFWKGNKGSFQAWGRVLPVEGESFRFESRSLSLRASVGYTAIKVNFEGSADFELKGRRSYKNMKLKGEYLWEWQGKNLVELQLQHGSTFASLDYSLKDEFLEGSFSGLVLDKELLGIDRKVYGVASGELKVDLKGKSLFLQAHSPLLEADQHLLGNASLKLNMDYREKPKGSFEFSSLQPFQLSYRATFSGSNVIGDALLIGYQVEKEDVSFQLSYQGILAYQEGSLQLRGSGNVSNITYKDLSLGSGNYTFNLEGNTYSVELSGGGFSFKGEGSLKEGSLSGRLLLKDMSLSYSGVELKSLAGVVDINLKGERFYTNGSLSCSIAMEKLSSWAGVSFELLRSEGKLSGSFRGNTAETNLAGFSYSVGSFGGRLEGERVSFSFDIKEGIKGKGYYSLKAGNYRVEGSIKQGLKDFTLASSYSVEGAGKDVELSLYGTGLYKNLSFPLKARLKAKGDRVEGRLEGFTLKDKVVSLRIEGAELYGSRKEINLKVAPVSLMLGQELLGRLDFEKGSYKEGSFHIEGRISGTMEGSIVVDYQKSLSVSSEGLIKLGELSTFIRSRILADLEGEVSYRLSYADNNFHFFGRSRRLTVRSRYLAVPLQGSMELSLKNEELSGFLQLQGERKAFLFAHLRGDKAGGRVFFEIKRLPVLYREENLRASLLLFGEGNISSDYKSINIGGRFSTSGVINLQKTPEKKTTPPPEEYRRVNLDLSVSSSEPLRVNLPEGSIYTDLSVSVKGSLYEPDYKVKASLKGGKLRYFDRDFYVSKGEVRFARRENSLDLTITTLMPEYTIILDVKGNPQYPKVVVRSEPPRDSREVITALVLGSSESESLIPVAGALISQIPQLGNLIEGAKGITGLDVKFQVYPSASPSGEVGVNASVSKEITERISVEHKQSTHKDPKETYTAGDVKLTPTISIGGRIYSDRTQEVKIKIRRKFDF